MYLWPWRSAVAWVTEAYLIAHGLFGRTHVFFHTLVTAPKSTFCPTEETWWPGLVIIIAVCCATLVFLLVVVIICYKAIKR